MTGRRKHPIWFHFDENITEGKTKRAICKDCKVSIVALVERMLKHKMTCTPRYVNETIENNYNNDESVEEKRISSNNNLYETETLNTNLNSVDKHKNVLLKLKNSFKQKFETYNKITTTESEKLDKQVAKMILSTNSSYKLVEHPEFKAMIEMLRPGYKAPNRLIIANELLNKTENTNLKNMHTLCGKSVCMAIDGWSDICNASTIYILICNVEEQVMHLVDTINTNDQPHTAEYLCDMVAKSIFKCNNNYNCQVTSIVFNSAVSVQDMHENLAKHPNLKGKYILTYKCSSHILNLLLKDFQIPGVVDNLKAVVKYFKDTPFFETKYKTAGGNTINLPLEVNNCSTLVDILESYVENGPIISKICYENNDFIDPEIINKVNNMNLYNNVKEYLDIHQMISVALIKSQSDTCTIGEATEIWLDLINKFETISNVVYMKIIQQFEIATTPAHYLANILDPRFEGKKLKRSQLDKVLKYVETYHPNVLYDLIKYQAHSGPFKDFLFTVANKHHRNIKPIVWWKSLEKTEHSRISEQMFVLNKQLHSTIASSSGIYHNMFPTFGLTNSKQADVENPNFQWNNKSEDSYAEVNDTNASGYEADSVLASMMHEQESIDYYHNQEPIIDVQEHQTWLSNRKYRGMLRGAGSDYSDNDGGGALSSRKMMRMSRPDTVFDEFSTFSDYVAERMRNLKADKALQLMARRDIEQVLFKYEMKLLEQKRDLQQQQQPDTEAATTSKSISPSPISDPEQP